ncbi:MAG: hypothetical protein H0U26_01790, partial [Acidimicrobiia bacterium]|nr:hypothetical protein [Acidimicrobiia bacterium]
MALVGFVLVIGSYSVAVVDRALGRATAGSKLCVGHATVGPVREGALLLLTR